MTKQTAATAEIVTFRLAPGVDGAAFVIAAQAVAPLLDATGAVLSRCLSCDADGTWTDHITWASRDAALQAAEEIMAHPDAQPMMQMIDPAQVQMRHAAIHIDRK